MMCIQIPPSQPHKCRKHVSACITRSLKNRMSWKWVLHDPITGHFASKIALQMCRFASNCSIVGLRGKRHLIWASPSETKLTTKFWWEKIEN